MVQIDKDYKHLVSSRIDVRDVLKIGTGELTATADEVSLAGDLDVSGLITGQHKPEMQTLTASGAITVTNGYVLLNHVSEVIAATLPAPVASDRLTIINTSLTGTAAHTVTTPAGVTFDGTNNTATFNLLNERLELIALSATRWLIFDNVGSVALSDV